MNIGSAVAHPNIALVKYWGKRDEGLNLPIHGSIGITLDAPSVHTTVLFDRSVGLDEVWLNGKRLHATRFLPFLNRVRDLARTELPARIISRADFPVAAGLASSAAAFAALAVAVNNALTLELSPEELSALARIGSGSAARATCGGFVEWRAGDSIDGTDSVGEVVAGVEQWPTLRMVLAIVDAGEKSVSSRAAMRECVRTSSLFAAWSEQIPEALIRMRHAIDTKDLQLLGSVAERNALGMHATLLASSPPIAFLTDRSMRLIRAIHRWREGDLPVYGTVDAGPNIKILCEQSDVDEVLSRIQRENLAQQIFVAGLGSGPKVTTEHLSLE